MGNTPSFLNSTVLRLKRSVLSIVHMIGKCKTCMICVCIHEKRTRLREIGSHGVFVFSSLSSLLLCLVVVVVVTHLSRGGGPPLLLREPYLRAFPPLFLGIRGDSAQGSPGLTPWWRAWV